MIKCPKCKRENRATAKICIYCGTPLVDVTKDHAATRALDEPEIEEVLPRWGSARPSQRITLNIVTGTGDKIMSFETGNLQELVIGRRDPATNDAPPIDLTEFGGVDKGVSRRHAAIIRKDGSLHIVDYGSYNGTFLNGQRLVEDQPRVLRDGDDLRFGHLTVRISFEKH